MYPMNYLHAQAHVTWVARGWHARSLTVRCIMHGAVARSGVERITGLRRQVSRVGSGKDYKIVKFVRIN
eukprot:COSAG02_NODE_597_length_19775_cov_28.914312_13_plen_69_part_00